MSKVIFVAALILAFISAELVDARSGGSSRSSSSSSRSSSSSSSSSSGSSKSWGGSGGGSKTWGGGSTGGGSSANKAATPKPAGSKADQAAHSTSQMVGGKYTSREAAAEAFKKEQGAKYQNRFDTEPKTRPDYIPNTTTVDGRQVNVAYDPQRREYGYANPRGGWFSYNPMMDLMMLNMLMSSHGNQYVYNNAPPPQGQPNAGSAAAQTSESHGGLVVILILLMIIAGIVLWRRAQRKAEEERGDTAPSEESESSDKPVSSQDKNGISFWRNVKPGDTLQLKDEVTVDEQIKAGKGVDGLFIPVSRTASVQSGGGAVQWIFIELKDTAPKTYVMAKAVGEFLDLRLYREAADFPTGNRKDMLDTENFWVFEKPDNPDDFSYLELKYTDTVTRKIEGGEITYTQKSQGEMDGECAMNPEIPGSVALLATISEYQADIDAGGRTPTGANNELMFLEAGSPDLDEGGLIQLLEGRTLQLTDVDVLSK
jgi:hypothetical protein